MLHSFAPTFFATMAAFGVLMLLTVASVTDIVYLRIPNSVTLGIVGLFCMFAAAQDMPLAEFLRHFEAAGIVFGLLFCAYVVGMRIGGGDVKLLTVTVLWAGTEHLIPLLVDVAVFSGLLVFVVLGLRHSGFVPWIEAKLTHLACLEANKGVPLAVAIAAGFIASMVVA